MAAPETMLLADEHVLAAPAKVNLSLRVLGRRSDGYHLLDSLVAFADYGDRLSVSSSDSDVLELSGPFAAGLPAGRGNIVLRALDGFRQASGWRGRLRIGLEKNLPHPAGLGGGSADAAALLRLLRHLFPEAPGGADEWRSLALSLGADVPVCLEGRSMRMRGIGEILAPVSLPPLPAVLVNPGLSLATREVFAALGPVGESPAEACPVRFATVEECLSWLAERDNDLQEAAIRLHPEMAGVLEMLRRLDGASVVRMSGSGASCFALFRDEAAAAAGADLLARQQPGWWCRAVTLGGDE